MNLRNRRMRHSPFSSYDMQTAMDYDRRQGKVLSGISDILNYYLQDTDGNASDGPRVPVQAPTDTTTEMATAASNNDSNSIYSTYSPYGDTQHNDDNDELGDGPYALRLQQAFRSLCNISLRIASLRHDRSIAQEALVAAEDTVTKLGGELLLERLDLDGAANADEISDMLLLQAEPPPAHMERSAHVSPSPRVLGLQQAAEHTRQLRAGRAQLDGRLEMEERLLLWPGLEQWRRTVAEHNRRRRFVASEGGRDSNAGEQFHPEDDLDRLLCRMRHMLPRLGHRRLQQLREFIGCALQDGALSLECQEFTVPVQMFF